MFDPASQQRLHDIVVAAIDRLLIAAGFLTRLPLPMPVEIRHRELADVAAAFPVIGIGIGLLGGAAFALALAIGLPGPPAAMLAVLATAVATGGLHEDGLADTADGFGGGRDRETKLAIMRDSRSGAYGVLALVFSVGLRAAAVGAMIGPGAAVAALVAAHAVSRAALPWMLRALDPARADGLGAAAGRPAPQAMAAALGIGIAVALLALGLGPGLLALLLTALAIAGLAALARRQIGGYTGDVLGAAQQIGEVTMLLAAAAWM